GFAYRSMAVSAKTLAVLINDLVPMVVPPAATFCQLCPGLPGTNVAVPNETVGTFQLTSPTSEDPPPADGNSSANGCTLATSSNAVTGNPLPLAMASAKSLSRSS